MVAYLSYQPRQPQQGRFIGPHNVYMDFSTHAHGIPIYYLPGHGGRLTNGLGQALVHRGYEVVGRETVGHFKKLDFNDQAITIANDIKEHFWREDAKIPHLCHQAKQ